MFKVDPMRPALLGFNTAWLQHSPAARVSDDATLVDFEVQPVAAKIHCVGSARLNPADGACARSLPRALGAFVRVELSDDRLSLSLPAVGDRE